LPNLAATEDTMDFPIIGFDRHLVDEFFQEPKINLH